MPFSIGFLRRLDGTYLRLSLLLVALVVCLGGLIGDRLFGGLGLRSMACQMPELGLLALAQMVALLSGGFDLSIIATADLSALVMGYILTAIPADATGFVYAGWIALGAVASLAVAIAVGIFNGLLIGYLRISPILATLGSMTLVKGIAVGISHGSVVSGFPAAVVFLGNGALLGVPMPLVVFALAALPLGIFLGRTPLGIKIAMFGSNERALRFSGFDTRRVAVGIYVLTALLAFAAGLLMMARFDSANAAYGESYLLVTVLACVLGGIDPAGGFGKVGGLVLALVILQIISTACVVLGLSQFLTLTLWGGILIAVGGSGALRQTLRGLLGNRRHQAH